MSEGDAGTHIFSFSGGYGAGKCSLNSDLGSGAFFIPRLTDKINHLVFVLRISRKNWHKAKVGRANIY